VKPFILGLSALGWCSSASAADLPRFDVASHCSSSSFAANIPACERAEFAARDAVAANWTTYPEQRKHFCLRTETFRKKLERSYVNLSKCLADTETTT
jgi:hypothetical protein